MYTQGESLFLDLSTGPCPEAAAHKQIAYIKAAAVQNQQAYTLTLIVGQALYQLLKPLHIQDHAGTQGKSTYLDNTTGPG